ncbi:MAG: hypothetical protein AABX55_01860 [Nanoarchaeota archaeon]
MKEEKFDIKQEYNKLKYKLPKFENLDEEFEISSANIKSKEFLLRNVRRRVNEKVVFYCRIIEGLLYPNANNIIGMFEIKAFNEDEKEEISKIYKRLMRYERGSLLIDVNPDDTKDVDYINNLLKEWKEFKQALTKITEKMRNSWELEEKVTKDVYFG